MIRFGNRDASQTMQMSQRTFRRLTATAIAGAVGALALAGGAAPAAADEDPAGCEQYSPQDVDPSIRTFKQVTGLDLGGGQGSNSVARRPTSDLYAYLDAIVNDTIGNTRVKVVKRSAGTSELGRDIPYVIVGTPSNIDNLDSGRNDAAFWRGVQAGGVSENDALAAVNGTDGAPKRPALVWLTANVHGNEPAGGESTLRLLYELVARRDCANVRRLDNMDTFIMPSQNPDGRDADQLAPVGLGPQRTNAWNFDLNRDWGTLTQRENFLKINDGIQYPSVVYIDAHQQGGNNYFFPPNEDPVHHEVSDAAIDSINFVYGPAYQTRSNDQGITYQNYNAYDLFVPEYGDTVPSLLFGAAGMTLEQGSGGSYAKQVYGHYIILDETLNITSQKRNQLLTDWIKQWEEAREQGENGELEPNQLVSPIHDEDDILPGSDPTGSIYGYFYVPDNHAGDTARLVRRMQETGVTAYRLTADTVVDGYDTFGTSAPQDDVTLPAGSLWIPSGQNLKHWIQSLLGENPFQPFSFCYDVCTYSFSLLRGMSGNGTLTQPMPEGAPLAELDDPDFGTSPASSPYYAFATDSSSGVSALLNAVEDGATAWRAEDTFSAAGKTFPTGAAIIDGATMTAAQVAALSDEFQTPAVGMGTLPAVDRYAIGDPKIGLYIGTSFAGSPLASPPARCTGGHCFSLFVMVNKMGIAYEDISLITAADLSSSPTYLTDQGFTAFVNPAATIAAGAGATDIQNFVNNGGRYVSWGAAGTTTARNAGITNLNTQAIPGLSTGGATFDGEFETTNPLAWGFDNGGFIYRTATGDPVYDEATLTADSPNAVPDATAAVRYADPLTSFGYSVNATGPGQLPGRAAVVDQPFGSGHALILGFDAMFRAWLDSGERILLNGLLYPTGAAIPPGPPKRAAGAPADQPIPADELPAVKDRPLATRDVSDDLQIQVASSDSAALKRIVAKVGGPKGTFTASAGELSYSVRKARVLDTQDSPKPWALEIMRKLNARGVVPISATL